MNKPIYIPTDEDDLRNSESFPFFDSSEELVSIISYETRLFNLSRFSSPADSTGHKRTIPNTHSVYPATISHSDSLSSSEKSEVPLAQQRPTSSFLPYTQRDGMKMRFSKYSVHNSPLSLFPGAAPLSDDDEHEDFQSERFLHLPNTPRSSEPVIVNRQVLPVQPKNVSRNGSIISMNASIRSRNTIRRRNRTVSKSDFKYDVKPRSASKSVFQGFEDSGSAKDDKHYKNSRSKYNSPKFVFPVRRKTSFKKKPTILTRPNFKTATQLNKFLDCLPETVLNFYPEKAKVYNFSGINKPSPKLNETIHDVKVVNDSLIVTDPRDIKKFNMEISSPLPGTFRQGPNGDLEYMEKTKENILSGYRLKDPLGNKKSTNYDRYRSSMISKKSKTLVPYEELSEDIDFEFTDNPSQTSEMINTKFAWEILIRRILAAKIKYRLTSQLSNPLDTNSASSSVYRSDSGSTSFASGPPTLSHDSSESDQDSNQSDQDSVKTENISMYSKTEEKLLLPPSIDQVSPRSSVYSRYSTNSSPDNVLNASIAKYKTKKVSIVSPHASSQMLNSLIDLSDSDGDYSSPDLLTETKPLIPQRHSNQSTPSRNSPVSGSKSLHVRAAVVARDLNHSDYSLHSIVRTQSTLSSSDDTNQNSNVRISYYSTDATDHEMDSMDLINVTTTANDLDLPNPNLSVTDVSQDQMEFHNEDLDKFRALPSESNYPLNLKTINHSQLNSNKYVQNSDIKSMQGSISMVGTSSVVTDMSNRLKFKRLSNKTFFRNNDLYSLKSFDLAESDSDSEQIMNGSGTLLSKRSNLSFVSNESVSKFSYRKK